MTARVPHASAPRPRSLSVRCAPFLWLGLALVVAALGTLLFLVIAPEGAAGSELEGWHPLHAYVELELPGSAPERVAALVQAASDRFPSARVATLRREEATWITLRADAEAGLLVREVRRLAQELEIAPGRFTMGPHLARVFGRAAEDPAAALRSVPALLPQLLLVGSLAFLGIGAWARRRLPHRELAAGSGSESASRALRIFQGIGLGLVLALLVHVLGSLAERWGAPIVEQAWLAEAYDSGGLRWFVVLFVVLVAAPLGEEVFFRGYLLPALALGFGATIGIGLSALAFALVHGHGPALPAYLVYGVGLAVAARRTGGILTPVVAHATVNLVAVTALVAWS